MSEVIRIVRLSFRPECVQDFIQIFETSKKLIRDFEGCKHLELKRDFNRPNVYYTYSIWTSHRDLDAYRESELFKLTWAKTKILFDSKPIAYSLVNI